ncbi:hypothetical protein VCHA37P200_70210 [Vibrio chagasii]|nr:hypothetical protein VCHA34P116_100156 [Vibrio chagasii]CAH6797516.1 hypothetical protein VCHA35O137_100157 [Vibrio chagasii]CAH6927258.1 hypothetical protein VCHA37P194_100031 [Vibrio chagasii]CAH7026112.1 hypothetical protein VCHA36P166_40209 [Vibrio chagasii]CAH7072051.1 hypothetical protein VCHA32P90_90030 [Vibrio chagasii]
MSMTKSLMPMSARKTSRANHNQRTPDCFNETSLISIPSIYEAIPHSHTRLSRHEESAWLNTFPITKNNPS